MISNTNNNNNKNNNNNDDNNSNDNHDDNSNSSSIVIQRPWAAFLLMSSTPVRCRLAPTTGQADSACSRASVPGSMYGESFATGSAHQWCDQIRALHGLAAASTSCMGCAAACASLVQSLVQVVRVHFAPTWFSQSECKCGTAYVINYHDIAYVCTAILSKCSPRNEEDEE